MWTWRLTRRMKKLLVLIGMMKIKGVYDLDGKCTFQPGQAIVFEPRWALEKWKGGVTYRTAGGHEHPLKYGDIVTYLAEHSPARGHCVVVDYDGKVTTMLHPDDFRLATDEEV